MVVKPRVGRLKACSRCGFDVFMKKKMQTFSCVVEKLAKNFFYLEKGERRTA